VDGQNEQICHDSNQSSISSAEVEDAWSYTSHLYLVLRLRIYAVTPPYVITAWCLIKHMDNFTFTSILRYIFSFKHLYVQSKAHEGWSVKYIEEYVIRRWSEMWDHIALQVDIDVSAQLLRYIFRIKLHLFYFNNIWQGVQIITYFSLLSLPQGLVVRVTHEYNWGAIWKK
jgi:hypothetical protein